MRNIALMATRFFQAGSSTAEVSLKRYRYTGKERDEENGFTYHGARYHAPWLGRWTRADPIGIADGTNLYAYGRNNPILLVDPNGLQPTPRPASGVQPPPPTPPSLPEAGKHPEAILAESEFNAAWEQALEERYGGGSFRENSQGTGSNSPMPPIIQSLSVRVNTRLSIIYFVVLSQKTLNSRNTTGKKLSS